MRNAECGIKEEAAPSYSSFIIPHSSFLILSILSISVNCFPITQTGRDKPCAYSPQSRDLNMATTYSATEPDEGEEDLPPREVDLAKIDRGVRLLLEGVG